MKVTKKNTRIFVKEKLATDKKWAVKALVRIFKENQTAEEKVYENTIVENGIGFTGADGEILSSFAKQQIKFGRLSDKQMKIVHKKMPKYWGQVISMADEAKLNNLVAANVQKSQLDLKF
jgi:hypothetical protein